MTEANDKIIFDDVSKFYGEVLGVNRITLSIPPGITTLVGPNGSGKTTLMNLMTGLVQPSSGHISVMGLTPGDATEFFRNVGYCTQFDFFPRGLTGWQFILDGLMLHGISKTDAYRLTFEAIERVHLGDAAFRMIAGYSKGMRQKIRLAQAIAHHPRVLVLDELLASRMFAVDHCVEARLHADGKGVFLRTGDIDQFYTMLNGIAAEGLVKIDAVAPADDDANAIYQYLIGSDGSAS